MIPKPPNSHPQVSPTRVLFFRKSRDYAQRYGEAWLVFSANYGFMRPHELIENYNETFKNGGPNLVTVERLREQVSEKATALVLENHRAGWEGVCRSR